MERGTPGVLLASNDHHGENLTDQRGDAGPSVTGEGAGPAADARDDRKTAPEEGTRDDRDALEGQQGSEGTEEQTPQGGATIEGQPSGSSGEAPSGSPQEEEPSGDEPTGKDETGAKGDPKAGETGSIDSAAGKAIAGLMGWKIISGGDLDKSSIVNSKSFERLAKKQEDKRYKRWKNAGSWQ
jgi:hypothetical protein